MLLKQRLVKYWHLSLFRMALGLGCLYTLTIIALLGMIYLQTVSYLTHRTDKIITALANEYKQLGDSELTSHLDYATTHDLRKVNLYGLFSLDKTKIAGNLPFWPSGLKVEHPIQSLSFPSIFQEALTHSSGAVNEWDEEMVVRVLAVPVRSHQILIVGRDITYLEKIRAIILNNLLGGGSIILVLGLAGGFIWSIHSLKRIETIQSISERIMLGELSLRMPVSPQRDELDSLSITINSMMEEIERLVTEIKSVTDNMAHDLRTPLTRLRSSLYRYQQKFSLNSTEYALFEEALSEADELLGRFKALLRIAEIDHQKRQSGFKEVEPIQLIMPLIELFEALAEEKNIQLSLKITPPIGNIYADPELLAEALSNLLDNAIKFTPEGGMVTVSLFQEEKKVGIAISDTGIGIPKEEREAVMKRFYRGSHAELPVISGHGLGLSIVAAIVRVHHFNLEFRDSPVGTHLVLYGLVYSV